jgi:predicted Zn finger-like uncharacterized protein
MHPVTSLVCFGIRQVLGLDVENVAAAVEQHFIDHSSTLPRALSTANDKAWRALGVALAGDGLFAKVKVWVTASGDEKAFREQVKRFLDGKGVGFEGAPTDFRELCLAELNKALKDRLLLAESLSPKEIASRTAGFQRCADPMALVKGAEEVVAQVATALEPRYSNLAHLLRQPTPGGTPLLVSAFCYFFRREVEKDDELANGLFFDGLKQLSAAQARNFKEVEETLGRLRERLDQAFGEMAEELKRTRESAEEARDAAKATQRDVLNLAAEQQRLGGLQLDRLEEVRSLLSDVLRQLANAGMQRGEVKPRYSFSIRGEDERRAVHALLERFRQLPEEHRSQLPALQNGLGKLQVGIGEFDAAKQTFHQVAAKVSDHAAKGEAFYNAYLAALEKEQWDEALEAIKQAAALDKARFSPFPLGRYRPVRILGAGGFGTVFLCKDAFDRDREVAVKSLHAADLERGVDVVLAEAHTLIDLGRGHPSIIGVLDCTFDDVDNRRRPYIVMQYFPGGSLEKHLREREPLTPGQVLEVGRQVASAMKAAHDRGILHRDLKPENVLVRDAGGRLEAKVIDFGLSLRREAVEAGQAASTAKSRLTDSIAGTFKYAPPEQMGELPGVKVDRYSDVFSFGRMCCFALFRTTDPKERHWKKSPEHERLKPLLEKCSDEDPEYRCRDFGEVLAGLDALQPAAVRVPCPQCGTRLKVPAELLGKKVKCPKCSTVFVLSGPADSPNPPPRDPADPDPTDKRQRRTYWGHSLRRIVMWCGGPQQWDFDTTVKALRGVGVSEELMPNRLIRLYHTACKDPDYPNPAELTPEQQAKLCAAAGKALKEVATETVEDSDEDDSGGGTKRGKYIVFGQFPSVQVVRWAHARGWDFAAVRKAFDALGVGVPDTTLRSWLSSIPRQPGKKVAELTKEQVAELEAAAGKGVAPPGAESKTLDDPDKAGTGKAPRYYVLGHSVVSVLRWMGKQGWTVEEAWTALRHYGVEPSDACVRMSIRQGKTGSRGTPAELTPEEEVELRAVAGKPAATQPTSETKNPDPDESSGTRIFGFSPTSVLHWMGKGGWTFEEARRVVDAYEASHIKDATVRTGLTDGKNPTYSRPAPLTPDQEHQLKEARAFDTGSEEEPDEDERTRYQVTLADLVRAGLLHAGDKLLMAWKPRDGDQRVFEGTITATGEIAFLGQTFASPSQAAVHAMQNAGSERTTENGWSRWKTAGGVLLATLREQYLQTVQGHDTPQV